MFIKLVEFLGIIYKAVVSSTNFVLKFQSMRSSLVIAENNITPNLVAEFYHLGISHQTILRQYALLAFYLKERQTPNYIEQRVYYVFEGLPSVRYDLRDQIL